MASVLILLNLHIFPRAEGVSLTPLGFGSCDQSTDSPESGVPRLPTGEVDGMIRPERPGGKTIRRPRSQSKGGVSALEPSVGEHPTELENILADVMLRSADAKTRRARSYLVPSHFGARGRTLLIPQRGHCSIFWKVLFVDDCKYRH
jgi:hypothetical protein